MARRATNNAATQAASSDAVAEYNARLEAVVAELEADRLDKLRKRAEEILLHRGILSPDEEAQRAHARETEKEMWRGLGFRFLSDAPAPWDALDGLVPQFEAQCLPANAFTLRADGVYTSVVTGMAPDRTMFGLGRKAELYDEAVSRNLVLVCSPLFPLRSGNAVAYVDGAWRELDLRGLNPHGSRADNEEFIGALRDAGVTFGTARLGPSKSPVSGLVGQFLSAVATR